MFGRQAVLPVEVSSPTKENLVPKTVDTDHDYKDNLIDEHLLFHNKRLEKVKASTVDAQARQKKAYDKKRHNPDVFKSGSLVLKKDMKQKKRAGGKMDFKWIGPFKVIKSMGGAYIRSRIWIVKSKQKKFTEFIKNHTFLPKRYGFI